MTADEILNIFGGKFSINSLSYLVCVHAGQFPGQRKLHDIGYCPDDIKAISRVAGLCFELNFTLPFTVLYMKSPFTILKIS